MSKQPIWEFVANLGDATPLDSGGLFLYRDSTGQYAPELERLETDNGTRYEIHRVTLEKCACLDGRRVTHDRDFARADPLTYEEWFSKSLADVARSMGMALHDLIKDLRSDDIVERARGYQAIYDYHGWIEGDQYPATMTRAEVEARYATVPKRGQLRRARALQRIAPASNY